MPRAPYLTSGTVKFVQPYLEGRTPRLAPLVVPAINEDSAKLRERIEREAAAAKRLSKKFQPT